VEEREYGHWEMAYYIFVWNLRRLQFQIIFTHLKFKSMKTILTIIFLILSNSLISQIFSIENAKVSKHIKSSDHIVLQIIPEGKYNAIPNCDFVEMTGKFVGTTKDSLLFNANYFQFTKCFDCQDCFIDPNYLNDESNKMIAKSDVLNFTKYNSLASKKTKNAMVIIGGIIMIGGALTTINALVIGGENKNNYLVAGGAQLATGLIIGFSFNQSSYEFKKKNDPWKFK